MQFDCGDGGKTRHERLTNWHPWFAWYPVRLADHDCRWMERVERKGKFYCGVGGESWWEWEYRAQESTDGR